MSPKLKSLDYVELNRPTIFAHRGASAYAPENTLAAFELAVDQGADAIELDAKLSSDGQVVVIHDDTVDRTTNGTGRVNSLSLSDLASLDAGSRFSSIFPSQKIPALDDVFEAVGNRIFINVELTNYSSPRDDLPGKVISLVQKHHLERSVLLSSFNIIALIQARNLHPDIALGFLTQRGEAQAALRTKLFRFGPSLALHPIGYDITPQLLQTAQHSRCRVHTYTIDRPEDMQQLFAMSVDGIFTNDPVLAKKVLADLRAKNK